MSVLGIDPGTARTGFGVVDAGDDNQLVLVDYGVIKTPAGHEAAERLAMLHLQLQDILERHSPTEAAVEHLFFQKNVSTAIQVGQARGVILLTLHQAGLPIGEYSPQDIKLAVTGYGAADKPQMQRMVQTLLTMPELPQPDDAADALAIAICHYHSVRLQRRLEAGT